MRLPSCFVLAPPKRGPVDLWAKPRAFKRTALPGYYLRDSEDWSTTTPGPMVELIEIFCR